MLEMCEFVREKRPRLTPGQLENWAAPAGCRYASRQTTSQDRSSLGDKFAGVAVIFERMDRNEAVGLWVDCLELAADRESTDALRRFALSTANLARSALERNRVATFEDAKEWAYAASALRNEILDDRQ